MADPITSATTNVPTPAGGTPDLAAGTGTRLTPISGPPVPMGRAVPALPPGAEAVNVTIDGKPHVFAKGTNLLEACNATGAEVPYFCYHPGLSSPAVCRQCLVDVKGQPKPVPSCYTMVADKMEVTTASPRVLDIRRQMLEFTLLNHPIDCPICDKAGECTLQKHYFDWDAKYARNDGIKIRKAKKVDLGTHIVLDQERCILCTRCIRVCDEVAKQSELTMADRGDHEVLTTAPGKRLDNPYSLNTVDVCPVGALTAKDFRFAMRAWELDATPSVCPGCATGCNVEVHASRDRIYRVVPRENPAVNKHWMCDDGRFTYKRIHQDRLAAPTSGGSPVEWDKALEDGARLLGQALERDPGRLGVVFSAQSTNAAFVFKIGSTLTTASAASVLLINGGSPANVFWQVGSSATLGTGTAFVGNILALTSITLTTGTVVAGRALARNGAVTMDTNSVGLIGLATASAQASNAPTLGAASSFVVLGGATVTNTGLTTGNADLGVSPGTAVTGFPPGILVGGTIHSVGEIHGTSTPRKRAKPTATAAIVPVWITRNSAHPYRNPHSGEYASRR